MFCDEANLDYENVINQTAINKCCHELDLLLDSKIEVDEGQAEEVKCFFLEHWNF